MGVVSDKLIKLFKHELSRKIVNIDDLYRAQKRSEADLKTIKTPYQLGSEFHPFHAVYVSIENLVSVIAENLSLVGMFCCMRYSPISCTDVILHQGTKGKRGNCGSQGSRHLLLI